jgi:hypothetical protein
MKRLILTIFAFLACNGPTTPKGLPSLEDACAAYAQAWCAKMDQCLPSQLMAGYGDLAGCAARIELDCVLPSDLPSLAPPTVAKIVECTEALPAVTCDDLAARSVSASCL